MAHAVAPVAHAFGAVHIEGGGRLAHRADCKPVCRSCSLPLELYIEGVTLEHRLTACFTRRTFQNNLRASIAHRPRPQHHEATA